MANNKPNGHAAHLANEAYFVNFAPGMPEVRGLVEHKGGHLFKSYLGAADIDDAIVIIRSLLVHVRTQLIGRNPAVFVVTSRMQALETAIAAHSTPDDVRAYVRGLYPYRRLTPDEREIYRQNFRTRQGDWIHDRLHCQDPDTLLGCDALTQIAPAHPARLLALFQDFVDCRDLLLDVVELHERPIPGSELPYREVSVADFVTLRSLVHGPRVLPMPAVALPEPTGPDAAQNPFEGLDEEKTPVTFADTDDVA